MQNEQHQPALGSSIASVLYILGSAITALLLLRFVLQVLGANPLTEFVQFVYNTSDPLLAPFAGIFGEYRPKTGAVVQSVFDLSALVAALVYSLVIGLIARVVQTTVK